MPLFCTFPLSPVHFQHGHQERSHHPDDAAGTPVTHAHPSPAGSVPIEPLADRSHHHPNAETGRSASRPGAGEGGGSHGERQLTPHSRQRGRRAGQSPLPTPRPAPAPRGQTKPLPLQRRFLRAQQVPVTGLSPPLRAEETAPRGPANALKTPWELVMGGGQRPERRRPGAGFPHSTQSPRGTRLPASPPGATRAGALPKSHPAAPSLCSPPCRGPPRCPSPRPTQHAARSGQHGCAAGCGAGLQPQGRQELGAAPPAAMPGERRATGGKTSACQPVPEERPSKPAAHADRLLPPRSSSKINPERPPAPGAKPGEETNQQIAGNTHGSPGSRQHVHSSQTSHESGRKGLRRGRGDARNPPPNPARPQASVSPPPRRHRALGSSPGRRNFPCSPSGEVLLQPQLHPYLIHSNYTHILLDK